MNKIFKIAESYRKKIALLESGKGSGKGPWEDSFLVYEFGVVSSEGKEAFYRNEQFGLPFRLSSKEEVDQVKDHAVHWVAVHVMPWERNPNAFARIVRYVPFQGKAEVVGTVWEPQIDQVAPRAHQILEQDRAFKQEEKEYEQRYMDEHGEKPW